MAKPALVFGGTGMIGQGVVRSLLDRGIDVRATTRHLSIVPADMRHRFRDFDLARDGFDEILDGYGPGDFVVNCAGLIKQHIRDDAIDDRREAIAVNSGFPHHLAACSVERGFHIIHVTTDCVFSGVKGGYLESDSHDATDVYGKTKSLGEVPCPSVANIRCSVIGVELREYKSFISWVLSHNPGSTISGFVDHEWNGVTAPSFGRVVAGIVASETPVSGTVHLVPADTVSKFELSSMVLEAFGRSGVSVHPTETGTVVNRVLATQDTERNALLWRGAGFDEPPSIAHMVKDLGDTGQSIGGTR